MHLGIVYVLVHGNIYKSKKDKINYDLKRME
jgi:hypothetical protein